MKKITLLISLIFFSISGFSQIHNVNPDPHGEPWIVGGLRIPSKEEINKIPVIQLSESQLNKVALPSSLDNTTKRYFRPVFNQTDGCCAQASGVAYNFTYEMNRAKGTSANIPANQFPTHYTYNFLNKGSGSEGSWYMDGWDIIKANGCPTVSAYGGLATGGAKRWMTGYANYETNMHNRVKDYFAIDVSTPQGLETLKHWMYDHLDGSSDGSLANFAAGAANFGFEMNSNKVVHWGYQLNHAMTFVGWDDNISYDYNNDGQITNNIDINNDGIVNMKDWEKGALIMVNSWGLSWGNNGKAYVMYKTLADDSRGIVGHKAFIIHVKQAQATQLIMKVKMEHSSRKKITVSAGVSTNVNDTEPEYVLDFPLFNKQGGNFPMRGNSSAAIEISLDISPLLSYVNPNANAKFFLKVTEDDPNSQASGRIYDFIIQEAGGTEHTCSQHLVTINNNSTTYMSLVTGVNFAFPQITNTSLPNGETGASYSHQLSATGGDAPYLWNIVHEVTETSISESFPSIQSNQLTPTSEDDGYATQAIGFDFPFFGETYNQLYISTDGSIIFEPNFTYLRTESAIKGNKVIAVFASDLKLYPADGDGLFYDGDANHATFRWKTSLFGNQAANIDVAVTLYPNGEIKYFYGNNITTGLSWAAGVSDGKGSSLITSISGLSNPSNKQFKYNQQPFPMGMEISGDGIFQGTVPNEVNTWNIKFKVTDNNNISKTKTLPFTSATLGVEESNLVLLNCFPNPVKDFATFSYRLDNDEDVNLSVYDISGKFVERLVRQKQKQGTYRIIWKPNLKKGIYFYRLKTSKGTFGGKVIVE